MMQAPDRTHCGADVRPEWEPENPEDFEKKSEWGFLEEPGAFVDRKHVCKGDVIAETVYPRYEADPQELREEVESCGLLVVRVRTEEDPRAGWSTVILVAEKE